LKNEAEKKEKKSADWDMFAEADNFKGQFDVRRTPMD